MRFSAQVAGYVDKYDKRAEAIWKDSIQDVVEDANLPRGQGGRMRVDTGFLRNSGRFAKDAMPVINPAAKPVDGSVYGYDLDLGVLISAEPSEKLFYGYTASYAGHREYGANGQAPDMFVRGAAQKWQDIVNANAAKLENT